MKDLFNEEHDWKEHWRGTLQFNQENKKPIQKITVSFECEADVEKFAELTGYKITKKTKSIWFPFREKDKPREYAWIDNEKSETNE